MHQLILTVIALGLIAGLSVVTVRYLPAWAPVAQEVHELARDGARTLINAYNLRVEADEGIAPPVDVNRQDGGLDVYFRDYYTFLPRAPAGYAWTYGYTTESQLLSDGYAGNASGGLNWFCLYPVAGGASEAIFRGLQRAQRHFAETQYYVSALGVTSCGRPINTAAPSSFPAPVVVTVFVRYIPGNP